VASSGDELIGRVVVVPAEGRAEIKRLWVDPAMRGRGVASALLRAALKHAGENGARTIRLSVWH
jgi:putative acetyltransferase